MLRVGQLVTVRVFVDERSNRVVGQHETQSLAGKDSAGIPAGAGGADRRRE